MGTSEPVSSFEVKKGYNSALQTRRSATKIGSQSLFFKPLERLRRCFFDRRCSGLNGSRWPIHQGLLTHSPSLSFYPSPSGVHVFGLLATALVTDVIQLATGYHAPFFLTVCQPNYTAPGVSCDNNAYITQDICMGKDQYAIMSARWDVHAFIPGEFYRQINVVGPIWKSCGSSRCRNTMPSCAVVPVVAVLTPGYTKSARVSESELANNQAFLIKVHQLQFGYFQDDPGVLEFCNRSSGSGVGCIVL